jgi:glycosyltransferase involved in cell wall biosynthesis
MNTMTWQVLDTNSIWVKEFASALNRLAPTLGWSPQISYTGAFQRWEREVELTDPALRVKCFPVQRGIRYPAVTWLSRTMERTLERLSRGCQHVQSSALICTSPFYAGIAEHWRGPTVYYATDLTIAYDGFNATQVRELDERMCQAVTLVCPNSKRIAEYLIDTAHCAPGKITIIPNATRSSNTFGEPPCGPGPLPQDIADLQRPIAGVIGNLAANMDWELLRAVIDGTPAFTWVFVGPVDMPIADSRQRTMRQELLQRRGRVRFVGAKPYSALCDYARAFDVAVLPYRKREPTYSGSATRFYEHLAACRPIISSRGFAELLEKEPLLTLTSTSEEMICRLEALRDGGFQDGNEVMRWKASLDETWEARAASMIRSLTLTLQTWDSDEPNPRVCSAESE